MPKVEIPDEDFDFGGDKKPADVASVEKQPVLLPNQPRALPVVDEDDWNARAPEETGDGVNIMKRESNRLLWGVLIVAGVAVAGVGGYYNLRGDGGDKKKKTQKSAISENVTPRSDEKQVADFEIECSFNFAPPASYTAACEGQFEGNPKISFDRARKGDNSWDAHVEVEQDGKHFICPAVIKKPDDKKMLQKGLGGGGQVLKCVPK